MSRKIREFFPEILVTKHVVLENHFSCFHLKRGIELHHHIFHEHLLSVRVAAILLALQGCQLDAVLWCFSCSQFATLIDETPYIQYYLWHSEIPTELSEAINTLDICYSS